MLNKPAAGDFVTLTLSTPMPSPDYPELFPNVHVVEQLPHVRRLLVLEHNGKIVESFWARQGQYPNEIYFADCVWGQQVVGDQVTGTYFLRSGKFA